MGLSAFCLFECEIVGLRKSRRRFNSSRLQRPQPDSLMLTMHLGSRLLPSDDKSRCTGCGKHISSRSHCLLACQPKKPLLRFTYYLPSYLIIYFYTALLDHTKNSRPTPNALAAWSSHPLDQPPFRHPHSPVH